MVVLKLLGLFQKKISQLMGFFIVLLLLIGPLAWLSISHPQQIQNIGLIIAQNATAFTTFRWLLILAFFVFWPGVVEQIAVHRCWPADKIQFWMAQKFKITLWLILFELGLCENILLMLFHLLERI
jgi:hypothetical protein